MDTKIIRRRLMQLWCSIPAIIFLFAANTAHAGDAVKRYDHPHPINPTVNWQCLDARGWGSANGTAVQQWPCTGESNQRWYAEYFGTCGGEMQITGWHSCYRFRNVWAGRCLDVTGVSNVIGTKIQLYDCNWLDSQVWLPYIWDQNNAHFQLMSKISQLLDNPQTGKKGQGYNICLDVPNGTGEWGVQMQTWKCNGNAAQKFNHDNFNRNHVH